MDAALTAAVSSGLRPDEETEGILSGVRPRYGFPGDAEGIPSDAELVKNGAVIGTVEIDNQNIFNLQDPKDNNGVFRLADKLHVTTRPRVVRNQLLFKPGDKFSRRLLDESARILRSDSYFYDAWIRIVGYHDNKVDVHVTTRDVWTLNPGFNFGRSGGANSTGVKLQESNFLGTATAVSFAYTSTIDRSGTSIDVSQKNVAGTWIAADVAYANFSDGGLKVLNLTRPFYALDSHWSGSFAALDDTQTDPLYDLGQIVDQFRDDHRLFQSYYGWSKGLQNGWAQRWTAGVTYDEHMFSPVSNSNGTTNLIPQDRRFLYPFLEFDLVQDDYLKLMNHDQIGRTEDFALGTAASLRLGYALNGLGSTATALLIRSSVSKGYRNAGDTLLLYGDFSGRIEDHSLQNGVADASIRYYVEQSKNWLFFTGLQGTRGWNLDLENQILLGGDNGLRGYPLRYQDGTARALWTVEQRYFTDWYPFRLFRVGGAVFFDMGRTWGQPPLAAPSLGLLKDAGFGLRFGNSRSGLGNVIHVDLAFPLDGGPTIKRVQFLVQTEATF
ncbi:MAG TPA: hypothetical protein VH109_09750 [Steroidobacteraceae bacterium]|nr:hypothetical protein [Steroidobacteraceae bacterium]